MGINETMKSMENLDKEKAISLDNVSNWILHKGREQEGHILWHRDLTDRKELDL